MRFPRSNKFFHGQLDAAPFAGVLFLLVIFVALNTSLVFTPGVPIILPQAVALAGTANPTVVVAVDENGRFYYDSQIITEERLRLRLLDEVRQTQEPVTLVVQADEHVRYDTLVRLGLLAREAGIRDALLATRPPLTATPPSLGVP
jgi:biopolymer transport protein ExbD